MRFLDRRADVKTISHCLAAANGAGAATGRPRANGFTKQPDNRTGRGRHSRRRRPPRAGRTYAKSDHRLPGRRTERAQAQAEAATQKQRVLNAVRTLYYEALGAQRLVEVRAELAKLASEAVEV